MKLVILAALLVASLLMGCQRGAATPTPFPTDGTLPPIPTLAPDAPTPDPGTVGFDLFPTATPGTDPGTLLPTPVITSTVAGSFTNLRFAVTGNGFEQANFPEGTQEIYAIWDYNNMKTGDSMERVWYLNDVEFLDRVEEWDFFKYGFTGTVRDVYQYDYIDGVDAGRWKVELYLNGALQDTAEFTVGTP